MVETTRRSIVESEKRSSAEQSVLKKRISAQQNAMSKIAAMEKNAADLAEKDSAGGALGSMFGQISAANLLTSVIQKVGQAAKQLVVVCSLRLDGLILNSLVLLVVF